MTARTPLVPGQVHQSASIAPVPPARPLSDFAYESVGDNVVLYDPELNRYHTVNGVAFDIWRRCDGTQSVEALSIAIGIPHDVVDAAVEQLGESGLLEAPESAFESTVSRRRIVKLVAAGAIGAVGVPVVASITRVGPEASATDVVQCPDGATTCTSTDCCCCHPPDKGGGCDCSCKASVGACGTPGNPKICYCG
jgi:hypothetical protein